MEKLNRIKLDNLAKECFDLFLKSVLDTKIIELIHSTYKDIQYSKKFDVEIVELNEENYKRLLFEVLCLGILYMIIQSPNFIKKKTFLRKKTDEDAYKYFNERLVYNLVDYVEKENIDSMHEIVLTTFDPTLKFGHGNTLNPAKRIDEYFQRRGDQWGKAFGGYIANAINPHCYPEISLIGMEQAVTILRSSNLIMKAIFDDTRFQKQSRKTKLQNCNFEFAKFLIVRNFSNSIVPTELANLFEEFISHPCVETAEALLEYNSDLMSVFELSQKGGFSEQLFSKGDLESLEKITDIIKKHF